MEDLLGHVRQKQIARRKSEPATPITKSRSVIASLWIAPTAMPLDRVANETKKFDIFGERRRFGFLIARLGEVLRKAGIGAYEGRHGFVERNAQRFGLDEFLRLCRVATEMADELLDLARRQDGLAEIAESFPSRVELLAAFLEPVLQLDIIAAATAIFDVQLVRVVDRDGLLHVLEQLLEVDDVA